ncbi:MAG: hypothetical protein ACLQU3_26780, partial [Limisphaerales bacterium]
AARPVLRVVRRTTDVVPNADERCCNPFNYREIQDHGVEDRSKLKGVIETARVQVAELIGAQPREIIWPP